MPDATPPQTSPLSAGPLPATPDTPTHGQDSNHGITGLGLALVSAATFGASGVFSAGMLETGWSPAGAVLVRVGLAALLLLGPACWIMRGRWHLVRSNVRLIAIYATAGVAVVQLGFFNAITHVSIGVALLIEYLAPVLLVAWSWLRHGRRPGRLTVLGSAVAIVGLLLALDVTGPQRVELPGVLWALSAAVGVCVYFVISADTSGGLPPLALTSFGLGGATLALGALGLVGVLPMAASNADVVMLQHTMPWWVPVVGLAVFSGAVAYTTGIAAARRLGSKIASFLGLVEVVFAILFAWILLGQALTPVQLAGGAAILIGITLVRAETD